MSRALKPPVNDHRTPPDAFLDPPEITMQPDGRTTVAQWQRSPVELQKLLDRGYAGPVAFRHTGWKPMRRRILAALAQTGCAFDRLQRFVRCGSQAYVYRLIDEPTTVRVGGSACRDRWCQPCARDRARTIAANLIEHTAGRQLRFVTLTLKHTDTSLSEQLDRLHACFTALRRKKFWQQRVAGGCAITELTRNEATGQWHPHLHLIVEGLYLPHAQLRHHWHAITQDSYIVDIRAVRATDEVHRYVTKYITKPWTGDTARDPHILYETITALDGKRLCNTFGTWRSMQLTDEPVSGAWERLGTLDDYLRRARDGDTDAIETLSHLHQTAVQAALAVLPTVIETERAPPPTIEWHRQYDMFDLYALHRFVPGRQLDR